MRKVRVLLADDNDAVIKRVRSILEEDFEIVGTVCNGLEAVAETQRLDPGGSVGSSLRGRDLSPLPP